VIHDLGGAFFGEEFSVLLAGEHDRALEEAQALCAKASEEEVKTEAMRIMAEALRKQGKWSEAGAA